MDILTLGKKAAQAADDKKALRISLYDLTQLSDLCEYMLVCSATNERQTAAIADNIELTLKAAGTRPIRVEGKQAGQWVLIDYGSLVVHVFLDGVRDFYALEKLWPSAKTVPLP